MRPWPRLASASSDLSVDGVSASSSYTEDADATPWVYFASLFIPRRVSHEDFRGLPRQHGDSKGKPFRVWQKMMDPVEMG